jgi:Ca2+-binding EF-hand superfamily protein
MDRDGDGKLYLKEVYAWVERMKALRDKATASCLSLLIQEQGEGLFSTVDADRDGRLSVRELRGAAKLIDRLDANGDGCLALAEVPRQHQGSFEKGAIGLSPGAGRAILVRAGGRMPPPAPRRARGPAWFTKMDRNSDGDVSRKEFLGTDEQFRAIDADGDGLITAAEAEAFEKRTGESRR